MNNFEDTLKKLEELSNDIRRSDISLEDALKDFEEGVSLAKTLEKEIDSIEGKIQVLLNQPSKNQDGTVNEEPQLGLFTGADMETGSSGAPATGLRQ